MEKKLEELNCELRTTFKQGSTRAIQWRLSQLAAMASMLRQHREEIHQALQEDLGKSPFESFVTEIAIVLNSCDMAKKNLHKWMKPQKLWVPLVMQPSHGAIVADPLGVVLIFSTWNFPLALALNPLVGAIAAGNAAVLKCSENAPSVSALIARLVPLYLDSHAIRVVEGGVAVSEELLKLKWDKIFYTGSCSVGKIVMSAAAKHLTPVTLELGGKSPTIFDHVADLKTAMRRFASGKFGINMGQTCVAPDYVLVEAKNAQRLIGALVATLQEFFGTEPEKSADLSKIVNRQHFARLTSYLIEKGVAESIVHGGRYNEDKLFIEPTILLNPPLDSRVMRDEIFGPILPIITTESLSEAIDFVNSRSKPLCLYLFTDSTELEKRVVNETSAGSISINETVIHAGLDMFPFGGVGESGMGAYHGKYSFDAFSHMKPVLYRKLWADITVRYPPYSTEMARNIVQKVARFDYFGVLLALLGFKRSA